MKVTLKDLKKNKGVKKTYDFLTPVVELLNKEYKEIIDSFDIQNYEEALSEVLKNYEISAVYETPEKVLFSNLNVEGRHIFTKILKMPYF